MIEKNAIVQIADLVGPEDFYFDTHALIYKTMLDLFARRSPIDLLTVSSALKDQGHFDTIGGQSYLEELCREVLTASHIYQYALITKQKSTLRKLGTAGANISALGYVENQEVDELVDKAEQELFKVSQTYI